MEKEIAVSNTNSLIFIAKLNLFSLTKEIFREILVPKEVLEEIFQKNSMEIPLIKKELNKFLREVEVKNIKEFPLDKGEKSAISYCLENNIETFLSDDRKARIIAESLGLKAKGLLGIILLNLKNKKINSQEAEKLLKKAKEIGYYISQELYAEIISIINEGAE